MAQSYQQRLLLADLQAGTGATAISLAPLDCDLAGRRVFGEDTGKRGTRQEFDCGARILSEDVGGGFNIRPTVAEIDWFLQRAVGDRISTFPTTPLVPGETLPQFYGYRDVVADRYRYDLLVIDKLVVSGSEGQYLNFRFDFAGQKEVGAVTWPASPPAISCASQYILADLVFTLGGTVYPFKSFELSIDNKIAPGQQENALFRTQFESQGLTIGLNMTFATRSDTIALYRRAIAGDAGSLAMNNGTNTYTWAFANVKIPGDAPQTPSEGEITMALKMMIKRTTGTNALTVTKT